MAATTTISTNGPFGSASRRHYVIRPPPARPASGRQRHPDQGLAGDVVHHGPHVAAARLVDGQLPVGAGALAQDGVDVLDVLAGAELALACDLRYASREKAMFGHPEVGGGLVPGGGGAERLPRFIGRDRALEAILSSSDYDADLAERWGWVTRALPDAELDDFVDTMAARLASFDKTSLVSVKAMVKGATLP